MKILSKSIFFLLLVSMLIGCGQTSFVSARRDVQSDIIHKKTDEATTGKFRKIPDIKKYQNTLFTLLNLGTIHFYQQHFDSTIFYLNKAEERIQDQYTRRVSQEAGSILTNEYNVDYKSYPVEHLLVHFYKSLSFSGLHQSESAFIEVRKLQEKLDYFETTPGIYSFNSSDFQSLHYYSALIALQNGDENFARVCFTKGRMNADEHIKSNKSIQKINIRLAGLVPDLQEAYLRIIVQTSDNIHHLKVAYPVIYNSFQTPDLTRRTGDILFPVSAQFETEFEKRQKDLEPKMITRVVTKFLLANGTATLSEEMIEKRKREKQKENAEKKEKGEKVDDKTDGADIFWGVMWAFGNIMKIVNDVTEQADLRQWFLLPDQIIIGTEPNNKITSNTLTVIDNDKMSVSFYPPKIFREFHPDDFQRTINFNAADTDNRNNSPDRKKKRSEDDDDWDWD